LLQCRIASLTVLRHGQTWDWKRSVAHLANACQFTRLLYSRWRSVRRWWRTIYAVETVITPPSWKLAVVGSRGRQAGRPGRRPGSAGCRDGGTGSRWRASGCTQLVSDRCVRRGATHAKLWSCGLSASLAPNPTQTNNGNFTPSPARLHAGHQCSFSNDYFSFTVTVAVNFTFQLIFQLQTYGQTESTNSSRRHCAVTYRGK